MAGYTKEQQKVYNANYYKTKGRRNHLLKTYGVTTEWYNQQLQKQGGCCGICGSPEPLGRGAWHVDHDHKTNKLRGLLCSNCNLLIGLAKERIEVLQKAMEWLREKEH
jgi:hypothetical protein